MAERRLADFDLEKYFPRSRGWSIVERPLSSFDYRETVPGTPIICMDKDFGYTKLGYDPNTVPLSAAWPGASDGVIPYMPGATMEDKETEADKRLRKIGLVSARHGDYRRGDRGCAFRRALTEGRFEGLPPISEAELYALMNKSGAHYTSLDRPDEPVEPEGFALDDTPFTNILPDGGRYYSIAIWLGEMLGISYEQSLPMIEKTGVLMLPDHSRRLFVATS